MKLSEAREILGVSAGATEEDVRKQFRMYAMRWHPDKAAHCTEEEKEERSNKMKEINSAYVRLQKGEDSDDEFDEDMFRTGPWDMPDELIAQLLETLFHNTMARGQRGGGGMNYSFGMPHFFYDDLPEPGAPSPFDFFADSYSDDDISDSSQDDGGHWTNDDKTGRRRHNSHHSPFTHEDYKKNKAAEKSLEEHHRKEEERVAMNRHRAEVLKVISKLPKPVKTHVAETSITISIDRNKKLNGTLPSGGFWELQYRVTHSQGKDHTWQVYPQRLTETSITVEELTPGTSYDFRARGGFCGGGDVAMGDFSVVANATTGGTRPEVAPNAAGSATAAAAGGCGSSGPTSKGRKARKGAAAADKAVDSRRCVVAPSNVTATGTGAADSETEAKGQARREAQAARDAAAAAQLREAQLQKEAARQKAVQARLDQEAEEYQKLMAQHACTGSKATMTAGDSKSSKKKKKRKPTKESNTDTASTSVPPNGQVHNGCAEEIASQSDSVHWQVTGHNADSGWADAKTPTERQRSAAAPSKPVTSPGPALAQHQPDTEPQSSLAHGAAAASRHMRFGGTSSVTHSCIRGDVSGSRGSASLAGGAKVSGEGEVGRQQQRWSVRGVERVSRNAFICQRSLEHGVEESPRGNQDCLQPGCCSDASPGLCAPHAAASLLAHELRTHDHSSSSAALVEASLGANRPTADSPSFRSSAAAVAHATCPPESGPLQRRAEKRGVGAVRGISGRSSSSTEVGRSGSALGSTSGRGGSGRNTRSAWRGTSGHSSIALPSTSNPPITTDAADTVPDSTQRPLPHPHAQKNSHPAPPEPRPSCFDPSDTEPVPSSHGISNAAPRDSGAQSSSADAAAIAAAAAVAAAFDLSVPSISSAPLGTTSAFSDHATHSHTPHVTGVAPAHPIKPSAASSMYIDPTTGSPRDTAMATPGPASAWANASAALPPGSHTLPSTQPLSHTLAAAPQQRLSDSSPCAHSLVGPCTRGRLFQAYNRRCPSAIPVSGTPNPSSALDPASHAAATAVPSAAPASKTGTSWLQHHSHSLPLNASVAPSASLLATTDPPVPRTSTDCTAASCGITEAAHEVPAAVLSSPVAVPIAQEATSARPPAAAGAAAVPFPQVTPDAFPPGAAQPLLSAEMWEYPTPQQPAQKLMQQNGEELRAPEVAAAGVDSSGSSASAPPAGTAAQERQFPGGSSDVKLPETLLDTGTGSARAPLRHTCSAPPAAPLYYADGSSFIGAAGRLNGFDGMCVASAPYPPSSHHHYVPCATSAPLHYMHPHPPNLTSTQPQHYPVQPPPMHPFTYSQPLQYPVHLPPPPPPLHLLASPQHIAPQPQLLPQQNAPPAPQTMPNTGETAQPESLHLSSHPAHHPHPPHLWHSTPGHHSSAQQADMPPGPHPSLWCHHVVGVPYFSQPGAWAYPAMPYSAPHATEASFPGEPEKNKEPT